MAGASSTARRRSIEALPAIVAAVGDQIEVWMDGGIRSGQDVLKAWALGARGTMIGRAMVYGLGAMGEAGVTKALQIIHKELDVTMAFCGHTKITKVDRDILLPGTYPELMTGAAASRREPPWHRTRRARSDLAAQGRRCALPTTASPRRSSRRPCDRSRRCRPAHRHADSVAPSRSGSSPAAPHSRP